MKAIDLILNLSLIAVLGLYLGLKLGGYLCP